MAGATLVHDGLPWVASNTDLTIPTASGTAPGNGALVRLIADFAGREPEVAGKPQSALFEETLDRVGGERPLVVGDRLDTDIEGGVAMGWDTLLVLTGVTGLEELVRAGARCRPTYVAPDLAALAEPQPAVQHDGGPSASAGGARRSSTAPCRSRGGRDRRLVAGRGRGRVDPSRRPRPACRDRRSPPARVASPAWTSPPL